MARVTHHVTPSPMREEIITRGPAGLDRGDLMDRWADVTPEVASRNWRLRQCELCHGTIGLRLVRSVKVWTPLSLAFPGARRLRICHDECYEHYR